jgi:hypothetical protein
MGERLLRPEGLGSAWFELVGPINVSLQQLKSLPLLFSARLGDNDGEPFELEVDLLSRQKGNPGGENGRLDNRVLGAIKSEEVSQAALKDNFRLNPHPLFTIIDGNDAKLVIPAGVSQHVTVDALCGY